MVETFQLVLIILLFFVDYYYLKIKANISNAHGHVKENYNPVQAAKNLKNANLTMLTDKLYVD